MGFWRERLKLFTEGLSSSPFVNPVVKPSTRQAFHVSQKRFELGHDAMCTPWTRVIQMINNNPSLFCLENRPVNVQIHWTLERKRVYVLRLFFLPRRRVDPGSGTLDARSTGTIVSSQRYTRGCSSMNIVTSDLPTGSMCEARESKTQRW